MKIAVITEISTSARNADIMKALVNCGHEVYNVGMKSPDDPSELSIVETGFLSGLLLNLHCVDLVLGGCGTGQGYENCAVQYPNVVCGIIDDPLNAWLFPQINDGNCVSLVLNKGYGWGANENLKMIIENLLKAPRGGGYPEYRKGPQQEIRRRMALVNSATHRSFEEILSRIDESVLKNCFTFPGVVDMIEKTAQKDLPLYQKVHSIMEQYR